MQTRFTELFGIKHPVVLPGMSMVSVPKLVAAVSNAGGLGILATGPLSSDETLQCIREIRALTDKPFGIGVTLMMPGAKENAEVGLQEEVPVINFSLGKGDWIVKRAHAYGGKVIATVVNEKHALAAQRYGVDAILATGHEAAAHGGPVTSLVLVPTLADTVDIPVIGTGGFADGRGLIAALALGAEGIAMGSRFSISQESPIHENTKRTVLSKSIEDTLYTSKFDGMDCRVMKSERALQISKRPINLVRALKNSFQLAEQLRMHWIKLFLGALIMGPKTLIQLARAANATEALDLAIKQGDCENGVHLIGQVQGRIHDIPTVAEIMDRVMKESEEVQAKLNR
ncbi:MAG: nitronate monooxygenase [Pseudomonadales bacterium]|nr:nitronate monooxygenase [Pseudomonadales bacterium]